MFGRFLRLVPIPNAGRIVMACCLCGVQPIEQAGELIKRMNPRTLFHVDAVQGFGKFRIYPKRMNIDLMSVSAHKIHGPKGVGFLYINEKAKVRPIMFGGGQQKGMRSGTENVPGIAGMAKAIEELFVDFEPKINYLYGLKERFVKGVSSIEGIQINGPAGRDGAPHVVSVSIEGIRSEVMLHALEDRASMYRQEVPVPQTSRRYRLH